MGSRDVIGSVTIDNPWALSYYTHWSKFVKLTINIIARIPVCVGYRWGGVGEGHVMTRSQKSGEYFSGKYRVTIRAFF